jgi:hypothetical protein
MLLTLRERRVADPAILVAEPSKAKNTFRPAKCNLVSLGVASKSTSPPVIWQLPDEVLSDAAMLWQAAR